MLAVIICCTALAWHVPAPAITMPHSQTNAQLVVRAAPRSTTSSPPSAGSALFPTTSILARSKDLSADVSLSSLNLLDEVESNSQESARQAAKLRERILEEERVKQARGELAVTRMQENEAQRRQFAEDHPGARDRGGSTRMYDTPTRTGFFLVF